MKMLDLPCQLGETPEASFSTTEAGFTCGIVRATGLICPD